MVTLVVACDEMLGMVLMVWLWLAARGEAGAIIDG